MPAVVRGPASRLPGACGSDPVGTGSDTPGRETQELPSATRLILVVSWRPQRGWTVHSNDTVTDNDVGRLLQIVDQVREQPVRSSLRSVDTVRLSQPSVHVPSRLTSHRSPWAV